MPTLLGYASSCAVCIIDVISSYADEQVKVKDAKGVETSLGDRTVNALNTERIVGTIGTGVAAWMMKNKADTPLKRGIEIAHYAYVPLFIRSMVNIVRKEVLSPAQEEFHGRYGSFTSSGMHQTIDTPEGKILSPFN